MMASRIVPIAALAAVAALLLLAFLFLLLRNGGGDPLELTAAAEPDAAIAAAAAPAKEPPSAAAAAAPPSPVQVYVAGAVRRPGVYTLPPDGRLADAIAAAGGIAATADLTPVNLALKVKDEARYIIPDLAAPRPADPESPAADSALTGKTANLLTGELSGVPSEPEPDSAATTAAMAAAATDPDPAAAALIDLNTASGPQLETLPGIGPARAKAILAHRQQHGPFAAAEELTAVSGIGSGIYQNLQPLITVADTP